MCNRLIIAAIEIRLNGDVTACWYFLTEASKGFKKCFFGRKD
jgi:hypothetical protein